MKTRLFFTICIMGIAVIGGIIQGLSSHHEDAKKEDKEKARDKEEHPALKSGCP